MKFKIGDKVRILRAETFFDRIGQVGTIEDLGNHFVYNGLYRIRFKDGGYCRFSPDKFELVKKGIDVQKKITEEAIEYLKSIV